LWTACYIAERLSTWCAHPVATTAVAMPRWPWTYFCLPPPCWRLPGYSLLMVRALAQLQQLQLTPLL